MLQVFRIVNIAQQCADIGFEKSIAEDHQAKREIHQVAIVGHRHQEKAGGIKTRAEQNLAAVTDHPVGEQTTDEGRKINERNVRADHAGSRAGGHSATSVVYCVMKKKI